MTSSELASSLYFSKEAANYLGISVQRLAKLTAEGKVTPLKKTASGTVYLKEELEKRKAELAIFNSPNIVMPKKTNQQFEINTATRYEALNFATAMNACSMTEKKVDRIFTSLDSTFTSSPMHDDFTGWAELLSVDSEKLEREYDKACKAFSTLRHDDMIIRRGDLLYPELLAHTDEAPRFIYLRGDVTLLNNKRTVALVGSRNASDKGRSDTMRVAMALGANGITIVSGLAKGIDVTAHRTALENGFKTIAVIGTNLNQYYPAENKEVQEEIEEKGLILSQFPPSVKTERWFFPLRDGVMSGLSLASVIMEAGETSGALKQASFALKQGRLVLIPQSAFEIRTITWPAKLEKKGAIKVRSPKEIIDVLSSHEVYKSEIDDHSEQLSLGLDEVTTEE